MHVYTFLYMYICILLYMFILIYIFTLLYTLLHTYTPLPGLETCADEIQALTARPQDTSFFFCRKNPVPCGEDGLEVYS